MGEVPSLPPGEKIAVVEGPFNEAVAFTFRLRFPADSKIPAPRHRLLSMYRYSGTNLGVGDKLNAAKTKPLPAGSVAIMQPKTNLFSTKEGTIVQIHRGGPWVITYVNSADDPRKK